LHAARLFTAALARDVDDHAKLLVGRVDPRSRRQRICCVLCSTSASWMRAG
jgi:hypothetical protein